MLFERTRARVSRTKKKLSAFTIYNIHTHTHAQLFREKEERVFFAL